MTYVDGFVIPVPKKRLPKVLAMARLGARIWKKHGALEYRECVADDLNIKGVTTFPRQLRLRRGETVMFSWIVYRSKAHRNRVNAKVMADPRMKAPAVPPFDPRRMVVGGFRVLVER